MGYSVGGKKAAEIEWAKKSGDERTSGCRNLSELGGTHHTPKGVVAPISAGAGAGMPRILPSIATLSGDGCAIPHDEAATKNRTRECLSPIGFQVETNSVPPLPRRATRIPWPASGEAGFRSHQIGLNLNANWNYAKSAKSAKEPSGC